MKTRIGMYSSAVRSSMPHAAYDKSQSFCNETKNHIRLQYVWFLVYYWQDDRSEAQALQRVIAAAATFLEWQSRLQRIAMDLNPNEQHS
jgi:hypothetical protein